MNALPPELFEVINAAQWASAAVVLVLCVYYLATEYRNYGFRPWRMKLAFGFTVFLAGELPLILWQWVWRYRSNTGRSIEWMSSIPWGYVPTIFAFVAVFGMACIARAIVPISWGRYGYCAVLLAAAGAVILTRVIR